MGASDSRVRRFGRYEILGELGHGSMGVIFKARDPLIDRTVAVKTLKPMPGIPVKAQEELRTRFQNESRAAGRLSHPGIVVVHDVGIEEASGEPYFAMEFVDGQSLEQRLRESGPFDVYELLDLAQQLADALAYAHAEGVFHRDLKPANILLDARGRVRITDFGIARVEESDLTREGFFLGSPAYSSPEQMRGRPVDARSEVFSLGVILYCLLTDRHPFAGDNVRETMTAVLEHEPPRPSSLRVGLDPRIDGLVTSLLAKEASERPADMTEVGRMVSELAVSIGTQDLTPVQATHLSASPSTTDTPAMALLVEQGVAAGDRFPLASTTTVIGRRPGGIQLEDPELSGRHCELTSFGGELMLRDLKSTNGTFLGDRRIELETLRPGMRFRVGKTILRLELVEDDPVTRPILPLQPAKTLVEPAGTDTDRSLPVPARFVLTGTRGAAAGRSFLLPRGRTVIGRAEADIELDDPKVSRKHAEIEVLSASQIQLRDLASANGTRLNDVTVSNTVVRAGDLLGVGDSELRLDEREQT